MTKVPDNEMEWVEECRRAAIEACDGDEEMAAAMYQLGAPTERHSMTMDLSAHQVFHKNKRDK